LRAKTGKMCRRLIWQPKKQHGREQETLKDSM